MTIIDIRTFFTGYVLSILLCAIVMTSLWWQNRKRSPEIVLWLADYVLQFIGLLLITFRGILPDFFTIVVANFFIIGGTVLLYIGLGRYVGREIRQSHNYVMLTAFTLVCLYFTYIYPDIALRTINQSFALLYICAQGSWLMLRRDNPGLWPATRVTGIVFAALCIVSLLQIVVNLTIPQTHNIFLSGFFGVVAVLMYQILFVALTFALFLMVSRKLSINLEAELFQREQEEKIIRLRLSLLEFATTHSLEEVLQKTLDEIGILLESPVGFYHFVDEDQKNLTLQMWSTRTLKEFCKAEGKGMHYQIDQAGVWVDCIYQKRAVIHNDYYSLPHRKGLPEGHAPVIRELVVPIMRGGKVMAILGIGNKPTYYTEKDAEIVSYLADVAWEIIKHKKTEEAVNKYSNDLKERLKELNCLYSISEIVQQNDMSQEEILKECPAIISKAYQFPEMTACRIILGDHEYSTDNFRQTIWLQICSIKVHGEQAGSVEVCYLEERHKESDGPFLAEERNLLEAVADILGRSIESKQAEEALKKSDEQVRLLLNSTAEAIYGIDIQCNCTFANPSCLRMLGYANMEQMIGRNIHELIHHSYPDGSPMTIDECAIMMAFHEGAGMHRDDEVFWRADGTSFPVEYWSYPQIVNGEISGAVVTFIDITERKQTEEQIKHLATHDLLTDLPSMSLAKDRLSSAINMARRYKKAAAVMFIDLDGFKTVNDTLGHDAGDYVLKQVAQRLLSCVRETDTVARVGGDEFLIIASEINTPENVAQIAEKVIQLVSQPIIFKGKQAVVGTSIGIALFPDHGEDMDQLIKQADEAMYKVKNAGKNNFRFVDTSLK